MPEKKDQEKPKPPSTDEVIKTLHDKVEKDVGVGPKRK